MRFQIGNPLHLSAPPAYEDALLSALAFFRKQPREAQALNCLSMYLRQSEARVLGELKYYAAQAGLDPQALLMLIHSDPTQAEALINQAIDDRAADDRPNDDRAVDDRAVDDRNLSS